jgi:hypothetical protein
MEFKELIMKSQLSKKELAMTEEAKLEEYH